MEFDIERSPEHDLTDEKLWERIGDLLKEGDWVLIVSPPCNTFSRARFQLQHPGPKPLRNVTWPRGFPWLKNRDMQKVEEANLFVDRCLAACEIAAEFGGVFLLEHPEDIGVVRGERPCSRRTPWIHLAVDGAFGVDSQVGSCELCVASVQFWGHDAQTYKISH